MNIIKKFAKVKIVIYLLPVISVAVFVWGALKFISYKNSFLPTYYVSPKGTPTPVITKTFTLEEIKKFKGQDPNLPIYMVYESLVYDVSSGEKFYAKGKTYNFLVGKDATKEINLVGLGNVIKNKYPVVGKIIN